jgi:hypothetical protein
LVEKKYEFDFYFTHHSLPHGAAKRYPADYIKKVLSDMASQTEKIVRHST